MRYIKNRVASRLLAALLLSSAGAAHAEDLGSDCGPTGVSQLYAAWPSARACATGLAQGRAGGPPVTLDDFTPNQWDWSVGFSGPTRPPVIGADNTIFFGAAKSLYAYGRYGKLLWSLPLGQDTWGAPAIGYDGSIYIGASGGVITAVPYDGGIRANGTAKAKWTLTTPAARNLTASPVLGINGAIFFADDAGNVYGVRDNGTSGSIAWTASAGAAVRTDLALSGDGQTLYVASSAGTLLAFSTSSGAQLWKISLGTSPLTSPTVIRSVASAGGGTTTIMVGDSAGVLSHVHGNGTLRVQRSLGGSLTAAAVAPNGNVYLHSVTNTGTKLLVIDPAWVAPISGFEAWANMPVTTAAPVIDRNGVAWGNYQSGNLVGVEPDGSAFWSVPSATGQNINAMAMTNEGSLIFAHGFSMSSQGPGDERANSGMLPPKRVPYFDANTSPFVQMCTSLPTLTTAPLVARKRPGYSFTTRTDPDNSSLKVIDTLSLPNPLADSGCKVTICNDSEQQITNTTEINDLVSTSKVVASYPDDQCEGTAYPQGCEALSDAGLRCSQLPRMAKGACTEVRECVDSGSNLDATATAVGCYSSATAVSSPGAGDTSCPATPVKAVTPTFPGGVSLDTYTKNYPALNLWDSSVNTCLMEQTESATTNQNGGHGADSGRRAGKKWGVWAGATANMNFSAKPKALGFFEPKAHAHADFEILARVMGKQIKVLDVSAKGDVNRCNINGSVSVILFNQEIDELSGRLPAYTSTTGDYCNQFFDKADFVAGAAKNDLILATRLYQLAKNAPKSSAVITHSMCQTAFGINSTKCQPPYTAQKAADVVNKLIATYTDSVKQMQPTGGRWLEAKSLMDKHVAQLSQFNTSAASGMIQASTDLLPDVGDDFAIVGAEAEFPIGPLTVTLAINGFGEWGIDGKLVYGARFLPTGSYPGAYATLNIEPWGHIDVDAFVGVGFGFGGLNASVGFGGTVTLVDVRTPLNGKAALTLSPSDSTYTTRVFPAAFSAFQNRAPLVKAKQYSWKSSASLGAALQLTALRGQIDTRLRVKFFWFSKTWKKRLVKLEGKTWVFNWTGTMDAPMPLPEMTLPVLDSIPFPSLPSATEATGVKASDFTFIPSNASTVWPTNAIIPDATWRARAAMTEKMYSSCLPEII